MKSRRLNHGKYKRHIFLKIILFRDFALWRHLNSVECLWFYSVLFINIFVDFMLVLLYMLWPESFEIVIKICSVRYKSISYILHGIITNLHLH